MSSELSYRNNAIMHNPGIWENFPVKTGHYSKYSGKRRAKYKFKINSIPSWQSSLSYINQSIEDYCSGTIIWNFNKYEQ